MTISAAAPPQRVRRPTGAAGDDTTVRGVIERVVFRNAETSFAVVRLQPAQRGVRGRAVITATGLMPGVAEGEPVTLTGRWVEDRRHGATFEVSDYEPHAPTDDETLRTYLASGVLPGVGAVTAGRIVDAFGAQAIATLSQRPALLATVKGINDRRATAIGAAWAEQQESRALALLLQHNGESPTLAPRIQAVYGAAALAVTRDNPYRLVGTTPGVSFLIAERLARRQGLPERSASRTAAFARQLLSDATDGGHCFLPVARLTAETVAGVRETEAATAEALDLARREKSVTLDGDRAYLPALHTSEAGLARRLWLLQRTCRPIAADEADQAILATAAKATGVLLSDEQRAALTLALREPVSVITGGPGTGKTTALRALIAVLERRSVPYCLAAPTGRAARRLAEATGRPASTLHRLMEFAPGSDDYGYNADRPLPYRFVVVDEASMLDVVLAYHLGQALPPDAQLTLVGDVDQLPSVGPGAVLRDLIASAVVPVARLQTLFRQAAGSTIIRNARRIVAGEAPEAPPGCSDFFLVEERRPEAAVDKIVRLVTERIPRRYGLDPFQDVQVLCPVNRGPAGVAALNQALQQALNGARLGTALARSGQRFALGDKVMHTRNNYDLNVFNGEVGQIIAVDCEAQELHVEYPAAGPASVTAYGLRELDDLQLAYAATVHKAQGAEYPCSVLLLLPEHGAMLRRDLLYTAVTRASRLCVIVGARAAVQRAVRTSDPEARYTRLAERLRELTPNDDEGVAL